jgi:hypothetical protein
VSRIEWHLLFLWHWRIVLTSGNEVTIMKMLASFSKAEDAHLLRARLEGSGIAAYLRDELPSRADGGVKVDVADEDFEAASALIQDDPGGKGEFPEKTRTYSGWHYVRVFAVFALCGFMLVAVRNGVIAQPRFWAIPAVFGLLGGIVVAALALVRDKSRK